MDFVTVEGRTLRDALKPLLEVARTRKTIPVMGHVRLDFDGASLRLTANDLDVEAVTVVDAIDGAGEWSICLPARELGGIARVAGPMPVRIEPGGGEAGHVATIRLGDGEAVYTLGQLPASDFPGRVATPGKVIERFGNGLLAECLAKVAAYVSAEETRYYLNGVCWHGGPKGLRFVATDGHRLACCRYDAEPCERPARIIPRQTVALILRHMAGADVTVRDDAGGRLSLVFESAGLTLRSKLIDGAFPDFDRVIPQPGPFTLALKRADMLAAIDRLGVFGRSAFSWKVKLWGEAGRLALSRRDDGGAVTVRTASDWPPATAGADLPPIGVNGRYLADMLRDCAGEASLALTGPSDPFLIRDTDERMTRVLMPMRV